MSPAADTLAKYEVVIGLEVHVQLGTRTKIFCSCPLEFGSPPNTNVCPVCLGLPGALPVLNQAAVELALKAALALDCRINPASRFSRKNYFYPDLPKGYQISQYDEPLAQHGQVAIHVDGHSKSVAITRIHMEDDAGKSTHDGFRDSDQYTYVDINRSGAPLIEIVSEPDLSASDEAYAYVTELKQILQFVDVSDCDMEKGQLRCDANVSIRPAGATELGTKVEIKNLNSFRFLKLALDHEVSRQVAVVESGARVIQETRLYNAATGETVSMRSKEHAHDYRYFPEPDLLPLQISAEWLQQVRESMPELPASRRARFTGTHHLSDYDAQVLTSTRAISDYFEQAAAISGDPKTTANWVMGDLAALLNAAATDISHSPIPAHHLGDLIKLINSGQLSGKLAKEIFPRMFATGDAPTTIMEREGLRQISDSSALEKIVKEIIATNPKQVEQYKSGKTSVIGFLVGQVMKASRGQANPALVNEILTNHLSSQ